MKKINFLDTPAQYFQKKLQRNAILVFFCCLCAWFSCHMIAQKFNSHLVAVSSKAFALEKQQALSSLQSKSYLSPAQTINDQINLLSAIASSIPQGVLLQEILKENNTVFITGLSSNTSEVMLWTEKLQASMPRTQVITVKSIIKTLPKDNFFQFTLEVIVP